MGKRSGGVGTRSRTGRPTSQCDSRLFCDVRKCAIVVVMVQAVLSEVGGVNFRPAIPVVISDRNAKAPALIGHPRFFSDGSKRSVVIIVQEQFPPRNLLAFLCGKRLPVPQIDGEPA